jgi:hypothetical protein
MDVLLSIHEEAPKRVYEAPVLIELGDLAELTAYTVSIRV